VGTFAGAPLRMRVYLGLVVVAALVLPVLLRDAAAPDPRRPVWLTLTVLVGVAVLNVEMGRVLTGGVSRSQQPHKALSAWAFAAALLLPPPWLLLVVPVTYAHARWRGIRVPLWKWVGSAAYVLLAGLAAGVVGHAVVDRPAAVNWMDGNGGEGLAAILAAAVTFLAVETVLFHGSAFLNHAADEAWLRQTLRGPSFYLTELGVLVVGGLLCAVWTGGAWFVLLFVPIYMLVQRAALHAPLAASNDALERANRFKVDLMGILGHEIGNPLTSVLGHAQVGAESLEEGDLEQAARSLAVVERNAHQIRFVLHDVLTLVASESGRLVARPEPCAVAPALAEAVALLPATRRPEVSCPDDLLALVQPNHLAQMLANLLGNAEKYAGGATCVEATPDGDGRLVVRVVDAGPGVPQELQAQLFERFSRGTATSRDVAGTGLGLFITRELARANHGDLDHRDGRPVGAVFELSLPRAQGPR
jgi:signal transduction histidine kinase